MGDRDTVGLQRNDVSDNVATSPTIANITSTGSDHSKTISEVDDQEKKINYDSEKQVIPEEKEGGYGWVIVFIKLRYMGYELGICRLLCVLSQQQYFRWSFQNRL